MLKKEHNATTGEIIEVEMTADEIAQFESEIAATQLQIEAAEQAAFDLAALKASAKAKLIAGEPLTAAEADTLVI